jgi:hypothetical protein
VLAKESCCGVYLLEGDLWEGIVVKTIALKPSSEPGEAYVLFQVDTQVF